MNASDPKSIHSGALPEARPLDIATLGKARGLLDNASSATAHGDHKDAIGYVRQALDLLAAEVSGQLAIVRGSRGFGSSSDAKADPLVAAKERLSAWLVAEPGRTWDHDGPLTERGGFGVHLYERFNSRMREWVEAPSLASAILAALESAQEGGGRG